MSAWTAEFAAGTRTWRHTVIICGRPKQYVGIDGRICGRYKNMHMYNELYMADLLDVAALAADGVEVLHPGVELRTCPPQFMVCFDALRCIHTHEHHTHTHTHLTCP
jgi:hypothetical protein